MSDGNIGTNPASGGPILDAEVVTRNDGTQVYRERMEVTGSVAAAIADVLNQDVPNDQYGMVVRVAGGVWIQDEQFTRMIAALETIAENTTRMADALDGD